MKAIYVAVALAVSIGPVSATEFVVSEPGVVSAEIEPSRDREELLANNMAAADPAEDEISAALKAKVKAIIAFAREDMRNSADGVKALRSRIRVRCSVRHVTARPKKPSLGPAPAMMLSEPAAAEPEAISATLEACTIKLLQIRRSEPKVPATQEFSFELPAVEQAAP